MSFSRVSQHIQVLSYVLLGFVISATMFQLSTSLAFVLNIIDIKEAEKRKLSYNISMLLLGVVCIVGTGYELFFRDYQ